VKVAILAGGQGTRLGPETGITPKPMVEIGGRPLLWHIMRHYAAYGLTDFVVALGYKGEVIERYLTDGVVPEGDDWRFDLVDTGAEADTGARLRRLESHLGSGTLMMTYSDGVADVNLDALLTFHRGHGKLATLTAVHPPARFGHLEFDGERISSFREKPQTAEGWINGGFFVLERAVLASIPEGEGISFERDTLESLAAAGELMAYRHTSFWQCVDTPRDKRTLEALWQGGVAPWLTGG
jgi:glucose-1-phosphate cytidylyltransferase